MLRKLNITNARDYDIIEEMSKYLFSCLKNNSVLNRLTNIICVQNSVNIKYPQIELYHTCIEINLHIKWYFSRWSGTIYHQVKNHHLLPNMSIVIKGN